MSNDAGYRVVTKLKNGGVCRTPVAPHQQRQALIDTAVQIWADFGYQIYDLSSRLTHQFPGGDTFTLAPKAQNKWQEPRIVPRLLRIGRWEDNRRFDAAIGSFWASIPQGELFLERQNKVWAVNDNAGWADAWSAAFISWMMCESGQDMAAFLRHQSHYQYIDDAINGTSTLYKALEIKNAGIPQLGDLICADRSRKNTYQTLEDRKKQLGQRRPTHCDVVINHDKAKNRVFAIGGNVANGVTVTVARLMTKNGTTILERTPHRPWFTVLRWQNGGSASFSKALEKTQ